MLDDFGRFWTILEDFYSNPFVFPLQIVMAPIASLFGLGWGRWGDDIEKKCCVCVMCLCVLFPANFKQHSTQKPRCLKDPGYPQKLTYHCVTF